MRNIEDIAVEPPRRKPRERDRLCAVESCGVKLEGRNRRQIKYCMGHRHYDVAIATTSTSANCVKGMHARCKALYRPCGCKCHG